MESAITRSTESERSWSARYSQWFGVGIILLTFFLLIVAINPSGDFPVEDDWDYSKTVWNVLQTGTFHRLEVTQATVLFPALWGALWSQLLGYSFATLRASTLVLASGTLLLFYALLGELGFDVPRRVFGTLALMVAPAFVYLAFSFMTDIPLLFGIMGALYFYVRAVRTEDVRFALIASIFAALGFLARQVGALIPIAFALFMMWHARGSKAWRSQWILWVIAGSALPIGVVAAYIAWSRFGGGANWADGARTITGTLSFWLQFDTVGVFVRRYAVGAGTISLYVLALWLASFRGLGQVKSGWNTLKRWQQLLILLIAALSVVALVRAAARGEWFPYLTDIFTRAGFRPYLAFFAEGSGVTRPVILATSVSAALTVLAGVLGIGLSALAVSRLQKPGGSEQPRLSPAFGLVYLTTIVLGVSSLTFFTYFERYLLPLIPGAIVLILDATRRVRFSLGAGAVGIIVVGIVSVALMQDYFAWNTLRWQAGRALLASGVPVEKIDGGYEWNGWHLYDESIAYIRAHNLEMAIDPWKYLLDPEYMIAFQQPANYHIVQEYPFNTPLRAGGVDRFYVLQRQR